MKPKLLNPPRLSPAVPGLSELELQPDELELIDRAAERLRRWLSGRTDPLRDLRQSLALWLSQALHKLDVQRAPRPAFVRMVLEKGVCSLYRELRCHKRCRQRTQPTGWVDEDQHWFGAIPDPRTRRDQRQTDLQLDLQACCQRLNDQQRAVLDGLRQENPTCLADKLGLTRSQLRTCLAQIRERFEQTGLKQYLE